MKKITKLLALLLLLTGANAANAQPMLEKALDLMKVQFTMPASYTASQNEDPIYASTEKPGLTLNQIYGDEPLTGEKFFERAFGGFHSIFTHNDGECLIFVVAMGENTIKYTDWAKTDKALIDPAVKVFGAIKSSLKYGRRMTGPNESEREELKMMVTYFPEDQAKEMFNASIMFMFPYNLRGEVYKNKFTRCRQVIITSKEGLGILFSFMMTDQSAKNFDKYLKDIDKAFVFTDWEQ